MTLLAVERIKLFTTRSPWWCVALALLVTVGFAALITATSSDLVTVGSTQFGYAFGMAVVMVLATLAVTTEYRFNTIRSTFQAIPNRAAVLVAKTAVVATLAGSVGLAVGFGSLGVSALIRPEANLALDSASDWLNVAGIGPVYAIAAVLAVAVGVLVRHTAGAVSLLMIYTLAVENLVQLIPSVGDDIHRWMPVNVANKFLTGAGESRLPAPVEAGPPLSTSTLSPGWALAYFAGFAVLLLVIALATANRRDA